MHRQAGKELDVQGRSTTDTVLRDYIFERPFKAGLLVKSLAIYIGLKIRYGKRIKIHAINSIRGKLKIQLAKNSRLTIGKFLMTTGPLYIKATENSEIVIGDRCFFNHNCSITSDNKITIGDECNFGNNDVIVDHDHIITSEGVSGNLVSAPVTIGAKSWCGANVTVTKGITIGKGAVIAAGAVVVSKVESHTVYGGVPARKLKEIKAD